MAKPISELTRKLPPEVNAAASVKAAEMLTEMHLAELRKLFDVTQSEAAHLLNVTQPNIAQLEGRADTYISTLRNYLRILGIELEIIARLPDGTKVSINQFVEK